MDDHDLVVLKPMVTWGTPILGNPPNMVTHPLLV